MTDLLKELEHIKNAFGDLKRYINVTEKFLQETEKVKVTQSAATLNDKPITLEMTEIVNVETINSYPHIYRSSLFITICSTFEVKLTEICNHLNISKGLNSPFVSGQKTLNKALDYITKEANMNFPGNEKIWNQVTNLFKLRNNIVHYSGKINDKERSNLIQIAKNYPQITFNRIDLFNELLIDSGHNPLVTYGESSEEPKWLFFKKDFCVEAIKIFEEFFRRFFKMNP